MSIIRIAKRDQAYSVIGNHILRNKELSFRARGVLAWLLSHSEDWQVSSATIAEEGLEGRDAVRASMTELRQAGHLVYRRERVEGGRLATVIDVYEAPQRAADEALPDATEAGFSGPGVEPTGDGIPGSGDDAKPQVVPATGTPEPGPPTPGFPGPLRSTKSSKTRELSLRSSSLAVPANLDELIILPPDQLRTRFLSEGWEESDTAPWIFTRPDAMPLDLLMAALIEVRGIRRKDITDQNWSSLGRAAKMLRQVGADPLEVIRRGARYAKAKKFRPTPLELASKWAEWGDAADDRFASGDTRHADAVARATRLVSG